MKTLWIVSLMVILLGLPNAGLAAKDQNTVNLCALVINDDVRALKRAARKAKNKKAKLLASIECSSNYLFQGGGLLRLAIARGSYHSVLYLIKSLNRRDLSKKDIDGMTPLQWGTYYYQDNAASEAIVRQLRQAINN